MKFFTRKRPKSRGESDLLQLGVMRQQLTANETNYLLGMTTEKEYRDTLNRLGKQLNEMEGNYAENDNDKG